MWVEERLSTTYLQLTLFENWTCCYIYVVVRYVWTDMSRPGFTLYCVDVIKTRHDSTHGYFVLPVAAPQLEGNKILITDHKCVF